MQRGRVAGAESAAATLGLERLGPGTPAASLVGLARPPAHPGVDRRKANPRRRASTRSCLVVAASAGCRDSCSMSARQGEQHTAAQPQRSATPSASAGAATGSDEWAGDISSAPIGAHDVTYRLLVVKRACRDGSAFIGLRRGGGGFAGLEAARARRRRRGRRVSAASSSRLGAAARRGLQEGRRMAHRAVLAAQHA